MSEVIAWKNGIRKVWPKKQWELLGTDKYGWIPEPETPKEVARAMPPLPEVEVVWNEGVSSEHKTTTHKRKSKK